MTIILTDVRVVSVEVQNCCATNLSLDFCCAPKHSSPVSPCLSLAMPLPSEHILSQFILPLYPTPKEVQTSFREQVCPCPMEIILLLSPLIATSHYNILTYWSNCYFVAWTVQKILMFGKSL